MGGFNKATKGRKYTHKKQGAHLRGFAGSAGGADGIAHGYLTKQIHGKRAAHSKKRG
jgi:hypothetical protein